jgi:alpha-beta hydrolase superfamily lysophospholipase
VREVVLNRASAALQRVALVAALMFAPWAYPAPLPFGKNRLEVDVDGAAIEVHTFKPQHYAGGAFLLTLHGVGSNAAGYRDHASTIAERHGFLVIAPLFDRRRFPVWRYQAGGLVRSAVADSSRTLQVEPDAQWTGRVFLRIIEAVRAVEMTPDAPYYLLGHSAGAQSLSRVAGVMQTGAKRIVIANPGTYLFPSREARFPDGFGGLPLPLSDDDALRAYLAQPITLLLGTADVKQDADLSMRAGVVAQGANRFERGHNAYRAAQALAQSRGWPFNWKLVEVPGVGHSAGRMFRSEEAVRVFEP